MCLWASLVAQMVKNPPAVQETWVWSLGWEDPLEKGMAPTPAFLPEEFHGQRSLVGYRPWSHKESDMTEWLTHCCILSHIQFSQPHITTGKTIALTRWTPVGKVMSLLFNMLSRLVIAFLPRTKHLLISWLQSPSAVILEPPKIKSLTVSSVSHLFAMK